MRKSQKFVVLFLSGIWAALLPSASCFTTRVPHSDEDATIQDVEVSAVDLRQPSPQSYLDGPIEALGSPEAAGSRIDAPDDYPLGSTGGAGGADGNGGVPGVGGGGTGGAGGIEGTGGSSGNGGTSVSTPRCGNGVVEGTELCDGDCPTSCPNTNCTTRTLSGSAATCDAKCVNSGTISICTSGDACCPATCNATNDNDCVARCGNGITEATELCDGNCPLSCPSNGCTTRSLTGSAITCDAKCVNSGTIATCTSGDACCPSTCNATNDNDCVPRCGNSITEGTELCDGNCPASCPSNGCTTRTLTGSALTCDAKCVNSGTISTCISGDSCCPATCNATNDSDCVPRCGNGITEGTELCDGNCPLSCPSNGCTLRSLTGSAAACSAKCVDSSTISTCANNDGCCPATCNANNDNNCTPHCGNNVVEAGEICDGNCPTSCSNSGCTVRTLTGSAATCSARCVDSGTISTCANSDGCCPATCNANNDNNCNPVCGNGVREGSELCDGNCPSSCPAVTCKIRTLQGSPTTCNSYCSEVNITSCTNNDGCCPSACDHSNDSDCPRQCPTDGVVQCAPDYKTIMTCTLGVWRSSPCPLDSWGLPGGCVPYAYASGGSTLDPHCGCLPKPCTCEDYGGEFAMLTQCGLDGIDEQLSCSWWGLGTTCAPNGLACSGGKPPMCP